MNYKLHNFLLSWLWIYDFIFHLLKILLNFIKLEEIVL